MFVNILTVAAEILLCGLFADGFRFVSPEPVQMLNGLRDVIGDVKMSPVSSFEVSESACQ